MNNTILLVFEGSVDEPSLFRRLHEMFLSIKRSNAIFTAVYGAEIFQLWQQIKDDHDFDLVGLLQERGQLKDVRRSEISEIYLFFDHDGHSHPEFDDYNIVVKEMISMFCEETENGKIYISYPMFEAIRDCSRDLDECYDCVAYYAENIKYKGKSARFIHFNNYNSLSYDDWLFLFYITLLRGASLILGRRDSIITFKEYLCLTQEKIAEKQSVYSNSDPKYVMVLSGVPYFVIDFCGSDLFSQLIEKKYEKVCSFGCYPIS